MNDQARVLRSLVEQRAVTVVEKPKPKAPRARTIAVTSGKGGVGKSNLALNLAIALKQSGAEVCLFDANFGLGNIDVLCGASGYWNLSHVVSGVRSLAEICREGPAGLRMISGTGGIAELANCPPHAQEKIFGQLEELENSHDYLIVDTGAGVDNRVFRFLSAADVVLVVTTPEPTSIADAYATIKTLSSADKTPIIEAVVNQAGNREAADRILDRLKETARLFLKTEVGAAGMVPSDEAIPRAVLRRAPLLIDSPRSPATRAIESLARRMKNITRLRQSQSGFFSRITSGASKRAA